jgi:hypothetical protein
VVDVEAILETPAAKLAVIVGDRDTAAKLREMAKALLNKQTREVTPTPAPTRSTRKPRK